MNASTSSSDFVCQASRLLKQDYYYDKRDLFLRANLADYETEDERYKRQGVLATIVNELRNGIPSQKSQRAIKAYAKLPGWFQVLTQLRTYNSGWAVLVEIDGQEKFYFVVETKGSNCCDE